MSIAHLSVRRPIAVSTLIIMMLIFGIKAYYSLGLDLMPNVEFPFVTVITAFPGASPKEIETDVARKIEDVVASLDGLKNLNTTCMENVCQILLEFELDRDVDQAASDVREKIDTILNTLPNGIERPVIVKYDVNATSIVTLALSGKRGEACDLMTLYDYADDKLKDRFSTIPGVANVELIGGEKKEIHINLFADKLSERNLTAANIIQKIKENNLKIPSGTIRDGYRELSVTFDGEAKNIADLERIPLGLFRGKRVYLGDVAEVIESTDTIRSRSLILSKEHPLPFECVTMKIIKKGEANTVKVVEAIKQRFDKINQDGLPGGMELLWYNDSGDFIQASVDDAWSSITFGILLTAMILYFFLFNLRSALIAFITMPISILISFAGMKFFNFTFNMSTLLSLGLSVGILVSNSILVLENIVRHLQKGEDPKTASSEGTSEVILPVLAGALTNVVVFVPIATMSSLVGRYFAPFAITMTVATLVSLFISFTLTPILAATIFKQIDITVQPRQTFGVRLEHLFSRFYQKLEVIYACSLQFCAKSPLLIVGLILLLFAATIKFITPQLGMDFIPVTDQAEVHIRMEYATSYNLTTTSEASTQVAQELLKLPYIEKVLVKVGKVEGMVGTASEGAYLSELLVLLTPKTQRPDIPLDFIRNEISQTIGNKADRLVSVLVPSPVGGTAQQMELQISGPNLERLNELGLQITEIVRQGQTQKGGISHADARDPQNTVRIGKPEIVYIPDRETLQNLNVSPAIIGTILRSHLDGIKAGYFKQDGRSFDIRITMPELMSRQALAGFTFPNPTGGAPLSLTQIAKPTDSNVPVQINRSFKQRIIKVMADPAEGVGLNDLVMRIDHDIHPLISGEYDYQFVGMVEKMNEAQADMFNAFIIAVILTYLCLAAILESWIQPILIMTTLPLGYMGIFIALFLTGKNLDMIVLLAGVMLIGIVVNNAILIMDEVNQQRSQGVGAWEAMLVAAPKKFRPIIMTSLAAVIGMIPMALGQGLGSEMRVPCGIASAGGIAFSAILTLYFIPMIFLLFTKRTKSPNKNKCSCSPTGINDIA